MQVIVCELRGTWAAALRRALSAAVQLRESRSLSECAVHLLAAPTSLVIVELTVVSAAQSIERIESWRRRFPACAVVVVASAELAMWRELAIESGAAYFLTSPRNLAEVTPIVERHARRFPQPATATAERIWSELPLATIA